LSGLLSKQGPMFRNSYYVTGHLWHGIARWPRGSVFIWFKDFLLARCPPTGRRGGGMRRCWR
jgi:hypothetical protein